MAELTQKERLQPSLLDRLTDDDPTAKQEVRDKRVLSPARLRESVRRDLSWLFNTQNLETVVDLDRYPLVAASTLNYGMPSLVGATLSSVDVPSLERTLREAIWTFEPRLARETVKVRLVANPDEMSHNALSFTIEADLWSQPLPQRLFLKTEIDLEIGDVNVRDVGAQGSR